jgi:hypothetical protein
MRTPTPVVLLPLLLLMPAAGIPAHAQTTARLDWWRVYDGPGHGVDIPNAAALDGKGTIHVAGRSVGLSMDNTVVSWSRPGALQHVLRYDSRPGSWDEANDVTVDTAGTVHVAGTSSVTSSAWRTVTIQYGSDGSQRWTRYFPADSSFVATAIAVGLAADGACYVASAPDFQVVKYSAAGSELWSARFRRDTSQMSRVRALAVAPGGDVYLVGDVSEECPEGICRYDLAVVKFDAAGTLQWTRYYTRTRRSDEQAVAVALDQAGNLLVAVRAQDSTGSHSSLVKYNPAGELEWVVHDPSELPRGIAVDAGGNAVIAGYTWREPEQFNYYVTKYRPSGELAWARQYDHGPGNRDFLGGLGLDRDGNIYLTGGTRPGYLGDDSCVTVRYSAAGDLIWRAAFGLPDSGTVSGHRVFVDSAGGVRVMASSAARQGWDYLAIAYSQIPADAANGSAPHGPVRFALYPNYPNPFNPSTTIKYSLPARSSVTLAVFNTLGQQVATLVQGEKEAGSHEVRFDAAGLPSGVYFYRLQAGDYTDTKRMLLMK